MSDEQMKALETENANLKAQIAQHGQGINGLLAQLDAHKATMNESLNLSLQLRTNLVLLQKQNEQAGAHINTLTKQLEDSRARITLLENGGNKNASDQK